MHWQEQNRLSAAAQQRREELQHAFWYAREAQSRPNLPASTRRRWRDYAERAKRQLADMGVFV